MSESALWSFIVTSSLLFGCQAHKFTALDHSPCSQAAVFSDKALRTCSESQRSGGCIMESISDEILIDIHFIVCLNFLTKKLTGCPFEFNIIAMNVRDFSKMSLIHLQELQ